MAPYDAASATLDVTARLDAAHIGDIHGAFGSIAARDHGRRVGWRARLATLAAIVGPGLIVMVGDNDAGAFGTYTQAGQTYGTSLLWTLLLLVPVLYVIQEMVLRLGAVTGVGHARLIFARFGKAWGAFSVANLFLLNALIIVTEFIGVTLGLSYLGLPKIWGVVGAAIAIIAAASTGSFRRYERFMMILVLGSMALVPIIFMIHPPIGQVARDFVTPQIPGAGKLSDVMLLIIAVVGTTIAPWQLYFQQSYVADKGITPRFIGYGKADLWIGIGVVVVGAAAMMAFTAAAFSGTPQFGHFTDAAGIAEGLGRHAGRIAGVLFAIALIDASVIGAGAVSLSSAYAIGDVLKVRHSLHRKPREAIGLYLIYASLIVVAAALVLVPGTPLGLLTSAVQTLAGVLLPVATVLLLLLCNDKAVLGPWVNGRWLNLFTGAVVAGLVMLSLILTTSVLYPDLSGRLIVEVLIGGSALALAAWAGSRLLRRAQEPPIDRRGRLMWRMPPIAALAPAKLGRAERAWLFALAGYLALTGGVVLVRIVQLALSGLT